jgi:hypothetical protein
VTGPEDWEQVCLAEVKRLLNRDTIMTRNKVIHDIRLDGAPPHTKLVIDLAVRGDERRLSYALWDDTFEGAPGQRDSAYHVGGLVEMWVGEEQ